MLRTVTCSARVFFMGGDYFLPLLSGCLIFIFFNDNETKLESRLRRGDDRDEGYNSVRAVYKHFLFIPLTPSLSTLTSSAVFFSVVDPSIVYALSSFIIF